MQRFEVSALSWMQSEGSFIRVLVAFLSSVAKGDRPLSNVSIFQASAPSTRNLEPVASCLEPVARNFHYLTITQIHNSLPATRNLQFATRNRQPATIS
jgi:hypothetical protein